MDEGGEGGTPESADTSTEGRTAPEKPKRKKKKSAAKQGTATPAPAADTPTPEGDPNALLRNVGKAITLGGALWMIYGGVQQMNGEEASTLLPLLMALTGAGISRAFKAPPKT